MFDEPESGRGKVRRSNSNSVVSATGKQKKPPIASKSILGDIRHFFLHKPKTPTLITFESSEAQEAFSKRIMQRTGLEVSKYSILNLHKIGIDAPVQHVFNELLEWSGESTCWPNYIARVHRVNNRLENIQILLFGIKKMPFGFLSPLFSMSAIRIQKIPASSDYDNARYLLYACSGGYPIGIFSMFVRSAIPEENESGQCQLFMAVGFDFYGRKTKFKRNPINFTWELIHNRVSINIMHRFKELCEWRFEKIQNGQEKMSSPR